MSSSSQQQALYQQQYRIITEWLQDLFRDEQQAGANGASGAAAALPQFELNPRTLHLLSSLAQINRQRTQEFYAAGEELRRQCCEYRAESKRLSEEISALFGSESSSESTAEKAQIQQKLLKEAEPLATVAAALRLRDTSDESFMAGLYDLHDELDTLEDDLRQIEKNRNEMDERARNVSIRYRHLESLHKQLNDKRDQHEVTSDKQKQLQIGQYFRPKQHDYEQQLGDLRREMAISGFDSDILRHSKLVEMSKQIEAQNEELEPGRVKLRAYHKLPADLDLARVELEEKKRLKTEIDNQIQLRIQNYEQ